MAKTLLNNSAAENITCIFYSLFSASRIKIFMQTNRSTRPWRFSTQPQASRRENWIFQQYLCLLFIIMLHDMTDECAKAERHHPHKANAREEEIKDNFFLTSWHDTQTLEEGLWQASLRLCGNWQRAEKTKVGSANDRRNLQTPKESSLKYSLVSPTWKFTESIALLAWNCEIPLEEIAWSRTTFKAGKEHFMQKYLRHEWKMQKKNPLFAHSVKLEAIGKLIDGGKCENAFVNDYVGCI